MNSVSEKRLLYLSLVLSQIMYCSEIWRPCLIKDIDGLEKVQHRAIKFILNGYKMAYRERVIQLNMLLLMYKLELKEIMFCVKSLKYPSAHFNSYNDVAFSNCSTRSGSFMEMNISYSKTNTKKHYFLIGYLSHGILCLQLTWNNLIISLVTALRSI